MRPRTLICAAVCLLAGCDGGSRTAPNQPSVLDRAILAAGGEATLASIRSVEAHSRGEQMRSGYQAVTQRLFPDRYRHDVDVSEARLVQATDGKDLWATIDDYPIPVTPEEADSLRESWRLAQVSMLLPLKSIPEIKLKEDGRGDGGDVLRVTFPADPKFPTTPKGPYSLLFDATTSLLKQIEFETVIFGASRARQTRIELIDYRRVAGVMIPYAARFMVDGEMMQEEHVDEVIINPAIAPERFQRPAPPADLVIKSRSIPEVTVALLEQHGSKPEAAADAEADLKRYVEKHDLVRNGPPFRLQPLSDADFPAVGVPIAPPPATTRPTSQPTTRELPRIAVLPARRVLTSMISATDPAARPAAIERLLSHARSQGAEPDGPCKIVLWSPAAVQLQLPIRARKD